MISNEGVGDAVRDGLRGANHSNSLAIARICNDADRPKPRPHTHEEIVNTFLGIDRVLILVWVLLHWSLQWIWTFSITPHFWIALGQIIIIDILLGGDNAVVIALACRKLPAARKKAAPAAHSSTS